MKIKPLNTATLPWPGYLGAGMIFLCILVFFRRGFTYDEPYYLSNIDLIRVYGLSKEFLIHLKGPAGPTYSVLHYLLRPVTGLTVIGVRTSNLILLICTVMLINALLRANKISGPAWLIFCIPMTMVCTGLALTEVPAMFFLVLSMYLLQLGLFRNNLLLALVAGLAYAISVLGRQPYLLLFPVFLGYIFYPYKNTKLIAAILFSIAALAGPIYCFHLWHGPIPLTGHVAGEGGFVYTHFFLACGYSMFAFVFIAPGFLVSLKKIGYIRLLALVAISLAISIFFNLRFPIMNAISGKILSPVLYHYFLNLSFAVLLTLSFYFIISASYRFFQSFGNSIILFSFIALAILICSTITITHQFSSRYVFQASPFIVMIGSKYVRDDKYSILLRCLGVVIGIVSLISYLFSVYG